MKTLRNTIIVALAAAFGASAWADIPYLDDVIIDGSLCVGLDCVNGESFGFDTIRLKENNLRIRFFDTSSTASFPTVDWQITANESSNGGRDKFSIDDIDNGRTPFTIEASAPSHSLYVDDGGRIGLGTSIPVVELHVVDGDTPTLRLEQDGSSGFTPQTWDVAGNETNFFIRDATHGSALPVRVFPDAPSNALTVEGTTGDVGIATNSPRAPLHVLAGGTAADQNAGDDLIIQDAGPARFALVNTNASNEVWTFNSNNTLRISAGTDSPEWELQANGNLELDGTCIEFDANNGTRFACTFSAGGAPSCAAAGSSCP